MSTSVRARTGPAHLLIQVEDKMKADILLQTMLSQGYLQAMGAKAETNRKSIDDHKNSLKLDL